MILALAPVFAWADLCRPGLTTSPFNLLPEQGALYVARPRAPDRTLRHQAGAAQPVPAEFTGCRALSRWPGREAGWTPAFSQALFRAAFCEGRNIAEEAVLVAALKQAGADPEPRAARLRAARRSRAGSRPRPSSPNRSASSARRPSSPATASCSGATTGWKKRSTGREHGR